MKKTGKIWVALITALSLAMAMNVWADTKITSISLKIDSSIEAGDSDSDVYVTTSSRYCSVDAGSWQTSRPTSGRAVQDQRSRLHYPQMVMRTGTGSCARYFVSGNDVTVTSVSRSAHELNVSLTFENRNVTPVIMIWM